jgi:hypothetical protein
MGQHQASLPADVNGEVSMSVYLFNDEPGKENFTLFYKRDALNRSCHGVPASACG